MSPTCVLLLALWAQAPAAEVPVRRHAIVIGNNHALPGSQYETLRYADDDAVRFATYFREIGAETHLLTVVDRETEQRFGAAIGDSRRPIASELSEVLDEVERALARDSAARHELYFVFSGHGSITMTEAYLHLLDERFTRTDLFERVLRRVRADRVHVIIDSCHSYFLVNARGHRVAAAADEEDLDRYPWVGFSLSTSDRREVQEWSGFQAGVFSYQLLGALRGAADVDRDGVVTYGELNGYVVAANAGVRRLDARIQPFIRRPGAGEANLVDLRSRPGAAWLELGEAVSGHYVLESTDSGRVLDGHKRADAAISLFLPNSGSIWVTTGSGRWRVTPGDAGRLALEPSEPQDPLAQAKGSISDELRAGLFAIPLTEDFVRGVEEASPLVTRVYVQRTVAGPWHGDPLTLGMLGTGAAGALFGVVAHLHFSDARAVANTRPYTVDVTADARRRSELWRAAMITGYAAGGALIVAGVVRALVTNEDEPALAGLAPTMGVGQLGLQWQTSF